MNVGPASEVGRVAGWYGKLPTVGDFASRRLEADFVDAWDRWLGDGLQAQRDSLGEAWLEAFLHSPSWRFLLSPGVLPDFDPRTALAGVVMPSVDRVGRYFPLTLAGAVGRMPAAAVQFEALLGWLDRLENTALEALQNDWSIDELEAGLAELVAPARASDGDADPLAEARRDMAEAVAGGGGFVETGALAGRADLASLFAGALGPSPSAVAAAPRSELRGIGFWIADGRGSPQLFVSRGLPGPDAFARMFGNAGNAVRAAASPSRETRPNSVEAYAPATAFAATAATFAPPPGFESTQAAEANGSVTAFGDAVDLPGREVESDLLAMFDGGAGAPLEDPLAHAPPRDDILALFGATGEESGFVADPAPAAAAPVVLPDGESFDDPLAAAPAPVAAHDDLLALFDKAGGDASSDASPNDDGASAAPRSRGILDLFGGGKPGPGAGSPR